MQFTIPNASLFLNRNNKAGLMKRLCYNIQISYTNSLRKAIAFIFNTGRGPILKRFLGQIRCATIKRCQCCIIIQIMPIRIGFTLNLASIFHIIHIYVAHITAENILSARISNSQPLLTSFLAMKQLLVSNSSRQ